MIALNTNASKMEKFQYSKIPFPVSGTEAVAKQRLDSGSKSDQQHDNDHVNLHGDTESGNCHVSIVSHQIIDEDIADTHKHAVQ